MTQALDEVGVVWLIAFPDGSFEFHRTKQPDSGDWIKGARLFEVKADVTVTGICNWLSNNMDTERRKWIKEITNW